MLKKKTKSYELDIKGVSFWRKVVKDNTEVFIKDKLNDSFVLYIDKVKGNNYLDWITGRAFGIEDNGSDLLIIPSGISISKKNIDSCKNVIDEACNILNNKELEEEYTNISEGIIYDSYFCNIISSRSGLDVIPSGSVYEEIENIRNKYHDNIETKSKSLTRKKR